MFEASRLAFDPLVPWAALWALVAGAVALWVVYVVLRGKSWLLRALAMSVLALALANPLWIKEEREPLKDIVSLVLDRSESMNFRGRTETAQAAFDRLRTQIEQDETLELRVAETDPDADGTDLYTALQSSLSDAPRERIAGAIVISDGQAQDIPTDLTEASQLGPVHALIVGGENEVDRRIEIKSAPSFGIVDNRVELQVQVDDPSVSTVKVAISVNGEARQAQTVRTGLLEKITLRLDRRGENLVVLQVDGIQGELTLANNLASARISGVQDRLRVLLITGEPHAGARVWRDLLKSDPSVDLVHFTILKPLDKNDATPTEQLALIAFPKATLFRDKLDEFDLLIFDHELRHGILDAGYFNNIARYVENGGALLIAGGPPYEAADQLYNTALAAVLPGRTTGQVVEKRFTPQLTDRGKRHSVTSGLPTEPGWGEWMRYMAMEPGTGAEALMKAPDGAPLLLLDRVDKGRVAVVMSDQLWFWARGYEGGGPYAELIRRMAHWLMKEPELEEEYLSLAMESADIKASLRTMSDKPQPLTLTSPDGTTKDAEWTLVSPGVYRASIPSRELGLYTAKSGPLKAVSVRGPSHPREYLNVRATDELVKPIVDATGGAAIKIGASGDPQLPDIRRVAERGRAEGVGWLGLRERNAYAVRATESTNLLPGVVGMLLAVALLMLAWRREGR